MQQNKYDLKHNEPEARQRLRTFWDASPTDRPALFVTANNAAYHQRDWTGPRLDGKAADVSPDWQAHVALNTLHSVEWLAEAMPHYTIGFGSAITLLAVLTGGDYAYDDWVAWIKRRPGVFEHPLPKFDSEMPVVRQILHVIEKVAEAVGTLGFVAPPTFIDPLTTLGCFRSEDQLCLDLLERPDDVKAWTAAVTQTLIDAYEHFYQATLALGYGEAIPWLKPMAEGRMEAVQCDFSIMLSPEMYREFAVPDLTRQTRYYDRSIYHLDGVENMRFIDDICSLPGLQAVQFNPGPSLVSPTEGIAEMRRIRELGKSIYVDCTTIEEAVQITRSLGPTGLMITFPQPFENPREAGEAIRAVEAAAR